jgi:hypothetical protein
MGGPEQLRRLSCLGYARRARRLPVPGRRLLAWNAQAIPPKSRLHHPLAERVATSSTGHVIARSGRMKIVGIEGLDGQQLAAELRKGGKFIIFKYCISIVILTFQRPSDIYFIRAGESAVGKGIGFSVVSLLLGWWGVPWGPIYTIGSLYTNFTGGKDVTEAVVANLAEPDASRSAS